MATDMSERLSRLRAVRDLPVDLTRALLIYGAVGVALWPIPLFNILHVESAAVIALVSFFAAGWLAMGALERGASFATVLFRQEAALLLPWAMLTVSLIWAPNCGYLLGLMFFFLFPVVSVLLGACIAFALTGTKWPYRRLFFGVIGAIWVVGGPLYDLGLHPQLYTYNHVFGGVLGPIYDEELAIRGGLFAFRGLSLLWAALAFGIGLFLRGRQTLPVLVPLVILIGGSYLAAPWLGFTTPEWRIQERLGSASHTAHFTVFYDSSSLEEDRLREIEEELEYRYAWLNQRLAMSPDAGDERARPPERIAAYLYPNPDVKADLTGARHTSVAPVWLPTSQMHLLEDAFPRSGAHELVHVFSRQFAATRANISPVAGLIEGVAVALDRPHGVPSPHEQVSAATLYDSGYRAGMLAEALEQRLGPIGFWTGRGAISYTSVGSFTSYLLSAYGPERFREVYRTGSFDRVYGKSIDELASEWEDDVMGLSVVSSASADYVWPRFAAPSLFEQRCPHYVPPHVRHHRNASEALADRDTTRAVEEWTWALERQPAYEPSLLAMARLERGRGNPEAMLDFLQPVGEERTDKWILRGDAYALMDAHEKARLEYRTALQRTPLHARNSRAILTLRIDLLETPDVLTAWLDGGPVEERAQRVEQQEPSSSQRVLAGWLWFSAGQNERALNQWRTIGSELDIPVSPAGDAVLHRQWQHWKAVALYRSRDLSSARVWYERAAESYRQVGDLNARDLMRDGARKMNALQQAAVTSLGSVSPAN